MKKWFEQNGNNNAEIKRKRTCEIEIEREVGSATNP